MCSSDLFDLEIMPVAVVGENRKERLHGADEGIRFDASMEALGSLKTLKEGGTITAGNASQVCDGASGVLVVSERALKRSEESRVGKECVSTGRYGWSP